MSKNLLFQKTRNLSAALVTITIAISLTLSLVFDFESSVWQVWLAVIALAVGIPHGALDHIVTVPNMQPARLAIFVGGYLAITGLVILVILRWPVQGFIFVVLMSAIHFGMGDASFTIQSNETGSTRRSRWWIYALPAGTLPVVVPLTNSGSSQALTLVNPALLNWHNGFDEILFWLTITIGIVAATYLLLCKQLVDARDLLILGSLAVLTPPLVAFSAYFGLWHALRHTARLSLEIDKPRALAMTGNWRSALWRTTLPGVPALIGTMIFAGVITAIGGWGFSQYFWIALVVVWALTVPHMALTWRLDRKVLLNNRNEVSEPV